MRRLRFTLCALGLAFGACVLSPVEDLPSGNSPMGTGGSGAEQGVGGSPTLPGAGGTATGDPGGAGGEGAEGGVGGLGGSIE